MFQSARPDLLSFEPGYDQRAKIFLDFLPNLFVTLLLNLADHSCWVKVSGIIVVAQGITIKAYAELPLEQTPTMCS